MEDGEVEGLELTFSYKSNDLRIKQADMQNIITEIKKFIRSNQQQNTEAEEQISEVEERLVEITDVEQKREKRLKTKEESLRELWDNVKCTNIHIIGVPEGEEREGDRKNIPRDNRRKLPSHGKGTTHSNTGSTTSTI